MGKGTEHERFWAKVDRGEGCWIWTASTTGFGYGTFQVVRDGRWRTHKAHRLAYEYLVGPIPEGMALLHSCDNPVCVNPAHLRPGTRAENNQDMMDRRRQNLNPNLGEKHGMHVLTESEVMEMRRLRSQGFTTKELGPMFGVTQGCASQVTRGHTWKHLPGATTSRRLTPSDVEEIRMARALGATGPELSRRFGIDSSYALKLCRAA